MFHKLVIVCDRDASDLPWILPMMTCCWEIVVWCCRLQECRASSSLYSQCVEKCDEEGENQLLMLVRKLVVSRLLQSELQRSVNCEALIMDIEATESRLRSSVQRRRCER